MAPPDRCLRLPVALLLLAAPLLAVLPRAAAAAEDAADPILQQALVLLDQRLAGPRPVRALRLLDDVAAHTGTPVAQVRSHLRQRLDDLSSLALADTAAWRALLDLRGPDMSKRQAERLVQALVDGAAGILADDSDYLLGTSGRHAARTAHVPADDARALILRLVAHGIVDTIDAWVPEPAIVVVSGWTEAYELDLSPLHLFFGTDDEGVVRENVRDVQRFLVPRLVRRLPSSRGVRFAVRERDLTPLLDPDHEARITVLSLRMSGSNDDLQPCMDARLDLRDPQTQVVTWSADLAHCTTAHGSGSTNELAPFFEEIADELFTRLDDYFETPR